jgi:hypothetical protein
VAELRNTFKAIMSQLPEGPSEIHHGARRSALGHTSQNLESPRPGAARYSFDPVGGAQVTLLPSFTKAAVSHLLMEALVDIPEFLNGLSSTFRQVNKEVTDLSSSPENNVHEIDVNEFYENLGYFLNPRTAHPSVLGATRMARMIESTTCGSRSM